MPSHLRETLYECFRILYRFPVLYSVSEIQKKALGSHLQYHAHTLSISIARWIITTSTFQNSKCHQNPNKQLQHELQGNTKLQHWRIGPVIHLTVVIPYLCSKTLYCVKHPMYTQASKGKMCWHLLRAPPLLTPSRVPILDLTVLIRRRGIRQRHPCLQETELNAAASQSGAIPIWHHTASLTQTNHRHLFAAVIKACTFCKSDFCCCTRAWRATHLRRIMKIYLQHSICYQPSLSSALQYNWSQYLLGAP